MKTKIITRTVLLLSLVSLFNDTASEMLYPIMPVYLKSIGFSVLLIGILEGVAEAIAGLSKGYFGQLSDTTGKRLPFVQLGYFLSAISKPMMALITNPWWVFTARTTDRLGKGLRTGARDAILSDEATSLTKGSVFGFHRSMDTFGAVLGPVIALLYLYFNPGKYKTLFFIAFIPGLLSILLTYLLKEKQNTKPETSAKIHFFSFIHYWRNSTAAYKQLVAGLLIFTLFNSSDIFLLLKLKESGLSDPQVVGVYIFYNLIFALSAYPLGILADKIGLKNIFITGLIIFAMVYYLMAFPQSMLIYLIIFLLYGIYAAATEGISKAWISNITDKKDTATAIGTYSGFNSIFTMLASSLAGLIWFLYGPKFTFILTASVTVVVSFYFIFFIHKPQK